MILHFFSLFYNYIGHYRRKIIIKLRFAFTSLHSRFVQSLTIEQDETELLFKGAILVHAQSFIIYFL